MYLSKCDEVLFMLFNMGFFVVFSVSLFVLFFLLVFFADKIELIIFRLKMKLTQINSDNKSFAKNPVNILNYTQKRLFIIFFFHLEDVGMELVLLLLKACN